jgi:hypothetical protein
MAYPRRCPLCDADYGSLRGADLGHVTTRSDPGPLLTLRCLICAGEYAWDYFADAGRRAASELLTRLRPAPLDPPPVRGRPDLPLLRR